MGVMSFTSSEPAVTTHYASDLEPSPRVPLLTYATIAVCIAVWMLEKNPAFLDSVTLSKAHAEADPKVLITSGFAHDPGGIMHLAVNMVTLWFAGRGLEAVVGHIRYAVIYLGSLLGGSFAFLALEPNGSALGASGAIFGLLAAMLVFAIRYRGDVMSLVGMLAVNAWISTMPGIAWQAHLGGFVVGLVLTVLVMFVPRRH